MLEALLRMPAAAAVDERLFDRRQTLHAPHLLDLEVTQVLRRYATTGLIHADRCRMPLSDLADFPLHRYAPEFMLPRIWELRANFDGL